MTSDLSSASFHHYPTATDSFGLQDTPIQCYAGEHDLIGLGPWGPYGKQYFGLSYLPGPSGVRIDFVAALELHRRHIAVPHAIKESGYLPWHADENLTHYGYRQQILPKDQLYADIDFDKNEDGGYTMAVRSVNNTSLARDVRLHCCVGLQPFAEGSWQPKTIDTCDVNLPASSHWIDALDYENADFGCRPAPGLNADGRRQGECVQGGFVGGLGIEWPSEKRVYQVEYSLPPNRGESLQLRYQAKARGSIEVVCGENRIRLDLEPGDQPSLTETIKIPTNCQTLQILAAGGGGLRLDGIALYDQEPPRFEKRSEGFAHVTTRNDGQHSLRWEGLPGEMVLSLGDETFARCYHGDLEKALLLGMHNHVSPRLSAPGEGHFHDFILPKLTIPPQSSITRKYTLRWKTDDAIVSRSPRQKNSHYEQPADLEGGDDFRFGVDRLSAVLQTNLVYPVRIKGTVIRHLPPGRWWDMLYTWDCGFIGLGLGEIAPRRAIELLNTYLTDPGDPDCAYIHHGSPVPVQHYLYLDLWQKTQNRELLAFFYPRLSQFLRYLSGLDTRSPTRPYRNSLLSTWSLFYNSGGWDDYPPQHELTQDHRRRENIAPMVSSSHVAAAADILAMAARELGEDPSEWENLADQLATDIDSYGWDSESGFYGYVEHHSNGEASGILRHDPSGTNYNLGLDGAMPLVTGRIRPERAAAIRSALTDTERFLTPLGLSTVDRTAPYYKNDGYWNGATWVPYQYIFWKAALDAGDTRFAWDLAERVLATYNRETEDSYCCFEHFVNDSERGAGWHHFGGLSASVINFFAAYFRPGRITTGFRTWIHSQDWDSNLYGVRFVVSTLTTPHPQPPVALVTLNPTAHYEAWINGQPLSLNPSKPGLLEVPLQPSADRQTIEIRRKA